MKTTRILGLGTAFAAAFMTAGIALADSAQTEEVTMAFDFTPAQLATAEGASKVYASLKREAHQACTPRGSAISDTVLDKMHADCINGLINDAVDTINSPDLRAVHSTDMKLASSR